MRLYLFTIDRQLRGVVRQFEPQLYEDKISLMPPENSRQHHWFGHVIQAPDSKTALAKGWDSYFKQNL